jgi:hypothetical protein
MPKPPNPRQEALAAMEEFERTRCHGGLSKPDSELLSRLRSDRYRDQLTDAWKLVGKYRKSPENDQVLIGAIFSAWHFALEAPAMVDAYIPVLQDFPQLRQCAEVLRAFFSGDRIQASGKQTTRQVKKLVQLLSWAIDIFDRGQCEISTLPERLRLNRKLVSPSSEAQRMRFTKKMCEAMLAYLGRPLYPAVASLASIVLDTEVSVDEVRGVSRPKVKTEHQGARAQHGVTTFHRERHIRAVKT